MIQIFKWPHNWIVFFKFFLILYISGFIFILSLTVFGVNRKVQTDTDNAHIPEIHSTIFNNLKEKNSKKQYNISEVKAFRLLKELWWKTSIDIKQRFLSDKRLPKDTQTKICSTLVQELKRKNIFYFIKEKLGMLWSFEPEPLPSCPLQPAHLKGRLMVKAFLNEAKSSQVRVNSGGSWRPKDCKPHEKLVIIVPYKDRQSHLDTFLPYIHHFLQRQLLDYRIIVVEQKGYAAFNKGALMNIGYKVAIELQHADCVIFHDVDLLPEHEFNFYRCGDMPRHMSVAVSSFNYKLPYPNLFGGIEAFRSEHFRRINGFSNAYFGWGGEDDDLYKRVYLNRLYIKRYPPEIATYTMLAHSKQSSNPQRFKLLRLSSLRQDVEGLMTAPNDTCLQISSKPLYTHVVVNLDDLFNELHSFEASK